MFAKVSDFFAQHEVIIPNADNESMPPWLQTPLVTDDILSNEVSKHESPITLLALSNNLIEHYQNHVCIYTDVSKTADGKVGIGCYIEPNDRNEEHKIAQRITDNTSVFAGEMTAIELALQTVKQLNSDGPVAIFSDSLSAVRCVKNEHSANHPKVLQEICKRKQELNGDTKLIWIPSHIGITGNQMADRLANEGTNKQSVDQDVEPDTPDTPEIFHEVEDYCHKKWENKWHSGLTATINKSYPSS